jgi:hypothetical protein
MDASGKLHADDRIQHGLMTAGRIDSSVSGDLQAGEQLGSVDRYLLASVHSVQDLFERMPHELFGTLYLHTGTPARWRAEPLQDMTLWR